MLRAAPRFRAATRSKKTNMNDFWRQSGFSLLRRDDAGRLQVTDAYLGAYLARPELQLVDESCAVEIAIFERLKDDPRARVGAEELAAMADADARENWQVLLTLRDSLVDAGTVESCYACLFGNGGAHGVPILFADQMVQVILRNILDGCDDAVMVRAAEMLFRTQKVMRPDGALVVGDRGRIGVRLPLDELAAKGDCGECLAGQRHGVQHTFGHRRGPG